MKTKFSESIFELVKKIPKGKVTTYKEIAKALGNKNSFRAVGNALNKNTNLIKVPCHRVIKQNGEVGGYVLEQRAKIRLLKKEGIEIKNNKIDLEKFGFNF